MHLTDIGWVGRVIDCTGLSLLDCWPRGSHQRQEFLHPESAIVCRLSGMPHLKAHYFGNASYCHGKSLAARSGWRMLEVGTREQGGTKFGRSYITSIFWMHLRGLKPGMDTLYHIPWKNQTNGMKLY